MAEEEGRDCTPVAAGKRLVRVVGTEVVVVDDDIAVDSVHILDLDRVFRHPVAPGTENLAADGSRSLAADAAWGPAAAAVAKEVCFAKAASAALLRWPGLEMDFAPGIASSVLVPWPPTLVSQLGSSDDRARFVAPSRVRMS